MQAEIEAILKNRNYEFKSFINKGAFGCCYLVKSLKYNTDFVCKCSFDNEYNKSFSTSYDREVKALLQLSHPNIVRVYDIFTEGNYLFLIMEYCSGGSLQHLIDHSKPTDKMETKIKYVHEIIEAINYMHERGFAHCDIKPSNILIDQFGRAKLADFGLTHFVGSSGQDAKITYGGSFSYMSPELLKYRKCDPFKADVWAFGVTIYTLFGKHHPFRGKTMETIICQMQAGIIPLKNIPHDLSNIIDGCLKYKPNERMTISQIKEEFPTQIKKSASQSSSKYNHRMLIRSTCQTIFSPGGLKRVSNSSVY